MLLTVTLFTNMTILCNAEDFSNINFAFLCIFVIDPPDDGPIGRNM